MFDVSKGQDSRTSIISEEMKKMRMKVTTMNREIIELCDRLNRELAHVGDMTVLRCGKCAETSLNSDASDWKVVDTKHSINEEEEEENQEKGEEKKEKSVEKTKTYVGKRSKLKIRHRRLFSKRLSPTKNTRVGFRGGKIITPLRPQTSG